MPPTNPLLPKPKHLHPLSPLQFYNLKNPQLIPNTIFHQFLKPQKLSPHHQGEDLLLGGVEGVFGRVDFREDGKNKRRENEEGKLVGGCLVGRERGKKDGGAQVFSLGAHQKVFSSK